MQIAYKSDIGRVADHNEDSLAIWLDQELCLVMVADGVGGHHAGEVASKIAVHSLQKALLANNGKNEPEDYLDTLRSAFDGAHQEILQQASQDDSLAGMATTMVLGLFQNDKLHVAHVGDSRAYRLQSRHLTPLTQDHSLVAAMVKSGVITPREAQNHALKNVITQCLGCPDYLGPEINTFDLAPGDIFLFCSDGLTDMLMKKKIERVVRWHARRLPQGVEKLVRLANKKGGRDNITVVLAKYE
ncbi:MAG: Stp1/IreP family PP2C-type Ser/Thr phosphatase [Deltaproteobacteria bacterium]|nr:MAG: Stp1/IreP family PP2C-type Ser/Thr phosphatase [Deltaproteobacteria bacterium]